MSASVEPVRLIQIGAGAMGRAWLATVAASPDATLAGLVDLDPALARQAADAAGFTGVPVAGSLEELLDTTLADAVLNVTIPSAHRSTSTTALRAGLPVLCEKPLAETVAAGWSMVAAARSSRRLLAISQSRRYWRTLDAFRAQVAAVGGAGTLSCSFFRAPHFGGFREEMDYPLLIDMAIHQFDLARDLIGAAPTAVYCASYNPGWSWYRGDAAASAIFEFANGARFTFDGSWCAPGHETSWNGSWRAGGPDGTAAWDGDNAPVAEDTTGSPLPVIVGEGPEQIAGSLAEFVDALRQGTVPTGEASSNILSLAMVEAAIRSAREARRVRIDEVLADAYDQACAAEQDAELRAVLLGWGSFHGAVDDRAATLPAAAG